MTPIDERRVRWGRVIAGLSVGVALATAGYSIAVGRWGVMAESFALHGVVFAVGLGSLSWVVIKSQPRNGFVRTLVVCSFFAALFGAAFAGSYLAAPAEIRDLTFAEMAGLVPAELPTVTAILISPIAWAWIPAFILFLTLGLLIFPDGRLPSSRWRWVGWLAVGSIATMSGLLAWRVRPSSTAPVGEPLNDGFISLTGGLFVIPLVAMGLSVAGLLVRYRRSPGETRQQIRWLALGAGFLALVTLISTAVAGAAGSGTTVSGYLMLAGEILIIGAIVIAITKYHLYDIDVVISKTVVYGGLAAFIALVYVGIVVGLGSLIGNRASFGLSIAATALVAIAFQPASRRLQRWANRLVYGERASPYEVLAAFSRRAADVDESELVERIPRLIVDGTAASEARLWTQGESGFVARAAWPPSLERRELEVSSSDFEDPSGDFSVPIFHDEELLGGISVVRGRGETITPAEEALVRSLASGLGLALHNAGLTERLRRQVADLEASRERILAAADEARRSLELDLDSGPLQRLVALKVKLGPTRLKAEREGAAKAARVLAQLENDAGDALRAVRDFASGIFPPLLEAEGLAVALTHETERAPFPVVLEAKEIGRYSREIEAAVYFCVLEAVQNAVKYAQTESALVRLEENGSMISFEVSDAGRGFDVSAVEGGAGLANMADRMDAVGGRLVVRSAPGAGTTVLGTVPVAVPSGV